MNKMIYATFAAALSWALVLSCAKNVEEEAPEVQPTVEISSLEAYIVPEADDSKTSYAIGAEKAVFNWLEGDDIDATISAVINKETVISSVPFTKMPGDDNRFQDGGIEGEAMLSSKIAAGYSLADYAFYPSRVSPEALQGQYKADWSYEGGQYVLEMPSDIYPPMENPLAVVPMAGKRDGEGKYAFKHLTGVLAIPISNLPEGANFITINSDKVALSGNFTLNMEGTPYVPMDETETARNTNGLTIHFSGLSGDQTFYFPVPVGTLPKDHLTITVGDSSDPDTQMTRTLKKNIVIERGHMVPTNAIPFVGVDQQWADFAEATFIDQFLWNAHSWSEAIQVTVQRSGLHPEKFRIANPYTQIKTAKSYTPSVAGTPDPYLVFYLRDNNLVYFSPCATGIDYGGYSIQIKHSSDAGGSGSANSKVVSALPNGDPIQIRLGAIYASYPYESGKHWTRDGASDAHIEIVFNWEESWNSIGNCTFIDNFIWPNAGLSDPVVKDIQQYSHDANRFRIQKPYPAEDADEWFEFNVSNPSAVTSVDYYTGTTVPDDANPEITWKAVVKNGAYNYTHCKVVSTQNNGLPLEVIIGPCYRDREGRFESKTIEQGKYNYEVGKDGADRQAIIIVFPHEEETWTSLGIGRYQDEWIWSANSFAPYDVKVEVWRSDLDANRYRVENPYKVANTAFKRTAATAGADDYLYLQIDPSSGVVSFDPLLSGMTKTKSGAVETNKSSVECDWILTDRAHSSSILGTDVSNSEVTSGTPAAPGLVKLYSSYYANGDTSYYYSNNTKTKYLWFPGAYLAGETWSDYCEGTYKDNIYDTKINSSSTLGTVAVTIQQSSVNEKRFRIANPYKALAGALSQGTPDDYLYFQYDNGLVYFEPIETGLQMDESSRVLMISHPVDANINNYNGTASDMSGSSVLSTITSGAPKKIQLGAYWYDKNTPTTSYCYTRGGNAWGENDRIIIVFDMTSNAIVTPKYMPLVKDYNDHDVSVAEILLPSGTLTKMVIKISGIDDLSKVKGLRLYQNGWMNNDYVAPDEEGVVTMTSFSKAAVTSSIDLNFWMYEDLIGSTVHFDVQEVWMTINAEEVSLPVEQDKTVGYYPGIRLNNGGETINVRDWMGEETCASFRIPAFCTTNSGALIAAYDVRYNNSTDLQEDIDVGFRRSEDGGKTWSPLAICMDMDIWGYETEVAAGTMTRKEANNLNGIGDPCLLVDKNTGDVFCFALWTHGRGGTRSLDFAKTGYDPNEVPQLVMVRSKDDGKTWSEPVILTRQVKQYDWRMIFQGPGNGITMSDGTLVIPNQHQKSSRTLHAGIMYSTDHGETWHMHNAAHSTTSESCVVEIEPGVLLLSMRDETNSRARRAYITRDLGRTWEAHASNGQMIEPTCEASMIKIAAADNVTGKDLILFSNPHSTSGRSHMTIQVSEDKAVTWPYKLLFDAGGSLGYTCLTQIDENTVGVVYECSRGSIVFQAFPITDIVK